MSVQLLSSRATRGCAHTRPVRKCVGLQAFQHAGRRANQVRVQATDTTVGPKNAVEVNDDTFQQLVLNSDKPVLVDFWAPWCGPCRMISTLIDELAIEYKDKLVVTKLNTDECPQTAVKYGIRSIPTVIVFKGGERLETLVGAAQKPALTSLINKYI